MQAARAADPAMVAALIAAGADVRARAISDGGGGRDALAVALLGCASTNVARCETCEALIAHGADVDAQGEGGETPLHLAVLAKNARLVAALLAAGARADRVNANGVTPLARAESYYATGCVEALRAAIERQR